MRNKTDWYPATINPIRSGWYEVRYSGYHTVHRQYWNGKNWLAFSEGNLLTSMGMFNDCWRGRTTQAARSHTKRKVQ